jgi:predicted esterase
MALLVGTRPEDPGDSGNPGYPSQVSAAISISRGGPTNEFITPGDAPTIFFHGTADRTVPYEWARSNEEAFRQAKVVVLFHAFEGAGHDILGPYRDFIIDQTRTFLWYMMDLPRADG